MALDVFLCLLLDDIAEKGCGHTDILKPIEMIGDDVTSEPKRPCTVYVVYVWRRMCIEMMALAIEPIHPVMANNI